MINFFSKLIDKAVQKSFDKSFKLYLNQFTRQIERNRRELETYVDRAVSDSQQAQQNVLRNVESGDRYRFFVGAVLSTSTFFMGSYGLFLQNRMNQLQERNNQLQERNNELQSESNERLDRNNHLMEENNRLMREEEERNTPRESESSSESSNNRVNLDILAQVLNIIKTWLDICNYSNNRNNQPSNETRDNNGSSCEKPRK